LIVPRKLLGYLLEREQRLGGNSRPCRGFSLHVVLKLKTAILFCSLINKII